MFGPSFGTGEPQREESVVETNATSRAMPKGKEAPT